METSATLNALTAIAQNVQLYVVPYAAYFLGIYIRRRYFPEPDAPSRRAIIALGVVVCLVFITPILEAARLKLLEFGFPYLATIGMVMEQGMVAHETAVSRLQKALPGGSKAGPSLQEA
jgi:hypothetical protein